MLTSVKYEHFVHNTCFKQIRQVLAIAGRKNFSLSTIQNIASPSQTCQSLELLWHFTLRIVEVTSNLLHKLITVSAIWKWQFDHVCRCLNVKFQVWKPCFALPRLMNDNVDQLLIELPLCWMIASSLCEISTSILLCSAP
jgi:hypothetical protein